jgi:hypothetical protein
MTGPRPWGRPWPRVPRAGRSAPRDPFASLGLDSAADLTDDDIRAAWRRIAAATHPDRADGGDPARFAAAASAYTDLRTAYGRGEARASLSRDHREGSATVLRGFAGRVRHGQPARLAARAAGAVVVGVAGVLASGHGPAAPALAAGALTWFLLTARADLAPPPDRS